MVRMLILGYAFGLRSERLLCREVKVGVSLVLRLEHRRQDSEPFGVLARPQ
jgi:hypothetical protein